MKPQALSDAAREIVLTAANIIYDPKGVEQLQTALANTKSKEGVVPTAAMFATTILHKMGDKLSGISEEEMWGKMGVVHSILGTLFEVFKNLGHNVPESDLKKAYEIVEDQMESTQAPNGAPPQDGGGAGAPSPPMQGAPPEQAPQGQPMMPMQGAMPGGM